LQALAAHLRTESAESFEDLRLGNSRNVLASGGRSTRRPGNECGFELRRRRTSFGPGTSFTSKPCAAMSCHRDLIVFFELLWNSMHPAGLMQLLLAEQSGGTEKKLLAGSIFLMFGQTISYTFNGARREDFSLRPNDAILSFAIQKACDAGFRRFDFGEVPDGHARLAEFKSKWGSNQHNWFATTTRPPVNRSANNPMDIFTICGNCLAETAA